MNTTKSLLLLLWTFAAALLRGAGAEEQVGPAVRDLLGGGSIKQVEVIPQPKVPHTSFQTAGPFYPAIGVPTDAVLVYSSDHNVIRSWATNGYVLQTMFGFRDYKGYVDKHPGEVQTDCNGHPLMCETSYYLDPTPERIEVSKKFVSAALSGGSTAICPEEPEYFTSAGYSEFFKSEWKKLYDSDWQAPHSSVDARYRSEHLKALLERRQIQAILKHTQEVSPAATRMVALHSPVTYYQWGIPVPHYELLQLPELQEVIGQVWTGTARSMARSAGVRRERTFEVGFLEYSSVYNLARETGKRLWFLMDPVEDNPNRPMEDYHINFEQTLLAALMFPKVDSYEVMPWPQRIFERIPQNYATELNGVIGALCDMWRYPNGKLEAGSPDIGTFVSDSMGWQRGAPSASDYDGFYALSLPLVLRGIPVQVLSLDRVCEPGYLSATKVLLLSYDFLKPVNPNVDHALAEWTRKGGALVLFDGQDAYNAVTNSWWRKSGFASPVEHLFSELDFKITKIEEAAEHTGKGPGLNPENYITVLSSDGAERNLQNRKHYTIDLTEFAQKNGSVSVRFEDATPQDGWGAWVASAELRVGGRVKASFSAGSGDETQFLSEDQGSMIMGAARFADASHHWVYRFDGLPKNTPVQLIVDMGNGFLVKARDSQPRGRLLESMNSALGMGEERLHVPNGYSTTFYSLPHRAKALCRLLDNATPIGWKAKVGRGTVTYMGIAPGAFTTTAQSDKWFSAVVRSACDRTRYRESSQFVVRRGPYTAVRVLDQPYVAKGTHINLLDPALPVVKDLRIEPGGWAFLLDAGDMGRAPRLMAASGRLRALTGNSKSTGFVVQGPSKTEGTARFWAGRRQLGEIKAFAVGGTPLDVSFQIDGASVLVRYPNRPEGVVVRAGWK